MEDSAEVEKSTVSNLEMLKNAVEKAEKILIKSKAIFPFDFFPDSITIDRQKLTIVHRNFWGVKNTISVHHSDVKNIEASIGPFMGSVTITSMNFTNNTQTVKYLPKDDVLKIQQLVQGFIVANDEKIETNDIDDNTLVDLLTKLGRGEAGERQASR